MSHVVRAVGWGWLLAGLLAVASIAFAHMGFSLPLPPQTAHALALPWSLLIPLLQPEHGLSLALTMVGVFINAQILFVIANVLKT